jgi:hypothetical protein
MAEEAIRGHILDPTSKEKDAISAASIILKAVASTEIWRLRISQREYSPSIQDLLAIEDASYALHHFKASYKGASPHSVLEDKIDCLYGMPRSALFNAQDIVVGGGEVVEILRLIAGRQFDQVERNQSNSRAGIFVQDIGIPLAVKIGALKYMLRDACPSKALPEEISKELDSIGIAEAKQIEALLPKMKGDLRATLKRSSLFTTKRPFSARQLSLFTNIEKRFVRFISRVERQPDSESKETLLVAFEAERAMWASMAAMAGLSVHDQKYRRKN